MLVVYDDLVECDCLVCDDDLVVEDEEINMVTKLLYFDFLIY